MARGGFRDKLFTTDDWTALVLIGIAIAPFVFGFYAVRWGLQELDVIDTAHEQRVKTCALIGGKVIWDAYCRPPGAKPNIPDDFIRYIDEDTLDLTDNGPPVDDFMAKPGFGAYAHRKRLARACRRLGGSWKDEVGCSGTPRVGIRD